MKLWIWMFQKYGNSMDQTINLALIKQIRGLQPS